MREVKPASFIYEIVNALPGDVCREMVRCFEANLEQQYAGRIGQAGTEEASIKKTTDLHISGRQDWKDIDVITHPHRAVTVEQGVKYIATTWICFA